MIELDPEDAKLVILARGAMGRAGSTKGAAVRDSDGRTYAAGEVSLQSLTLTAMQAAVAAAISSGAAGFEAGVVVGGSADSDEPGFAALSEVSPSAALIVTRRDGTEPVVVGGESRA